MLTRIALVTILCASISFASNLQGRNLQKDESNSDFLSFKEKSEDPNWPESNSHRLLEEKEAGLDLDSIFELEKQIDKKHIDLNSKLFTDKAELQKLVEKGEQLILEAELNQENKDQRIVDMKVGLNSVDFKKSKQQTVEPNETNFVLERYGEADEDDNTKGGRMLFGLGVFL